MKPGLYYVGDLCYVMHDCWNEVCDIVIDKFSCREGEFKLADGREFAMFNTAYGDGEYHDNQCRNYPVDSGSIGCILISDIIESEKKGIEFGNVIEFTDPFECSSDKRFLSFGSVIIDTADDKGDDYYEDDDAHCDDDEEF